MIKKEISEFFLSKSDQFNYYKDTVKKLKNKNKKLISEKKDLTKKCQKLNEEKTALEKELSKYSRLYILNKLKNNEYKDLTISIKSPNPVFQKNWGDYFFALTLKKYFERKGFNVLVQERENWYECNEEIDITIVLRGYAYEYFPDINHINVMWNLYNPHIISNEEFEKYDYIFVASEKCARKIKNKTNKPVETLLQCTDPEVFYPEFKKELEEDILFVGNTRGYFRKIIQDVLHTDYDVSIYGAEWESYVDEKYLKGEFIPNEELHKYYSSCKILLNDHLDTMKKYDYISNRLFDALACETLIISDEVSSIDLFEGAVVTYDGVDDLNEKIKFYLNNDEERRLKVGKGRKIVLDNHTFEKRVEYILNCLKNIKME